MVGYTIEEIAVSSDVVNAIIFASLGMIFFFLLNKLLFARKKEDKNIVEKAVTTKHAVHGHGALHNASAKPTSLSPPKSPISKRFEINVKEVMGEIPPHLKQFGLKEKEDWLYKKAHNFRLISSQKRFFVLRGQYILYFETEKKKHCLGAIDLTFIKNLKNHDLNIHFDVVGAHDYTLSAGTNYAAKDWFEKIKYNSEKIKSVGGGAKSESDGFREFCKDKTEIDNVYELNSQVPRSDYYTTLRFLRARKGKIPEAAKFLSDYMEWREKTFPMELTDDMKKELGKGKYYVRGKDKEGHITCHARLRLLAIGSYDDIEVAKNSLIYAFEWMCSQNELLNNPVDKWTLVVDLRGNTVAMLDRKFIAVFAEVLQNRYPERLHRLLIFPSTAFVRTVWSGLKHFFDPVTTSKVQFLNDVESLQEFIDPDQLNTETLGTDNFEFEPEKYINSIINNDISFCITDATRKKLEANKSVQK